MISWERKSNEFLMPLWKWDVISDLLREAAGRGDWGEVCGDVRVCVTLYPTLLIQLQKVGGAVSVYPMWLRWQLETIIYSFKTITIVQARSGHVWAQRDKTEMSAWKSREEKGRRWQGGNTLFLIQRLSAQALHNRPACSQPALMDWWRHISTNGALWMQSYSAAAWLLIGWRLILRVRRRWWRMRAH